MSQLSQLRSPAAVQAAIDEFVQLGRTKFLARHGYGKSRDFLVRDPKTGTDCDSKAIAGVAFGKQFPEQGPLTADSFSGGEATVVPALTRLGFRIIRIGEDWSEEEVLATVEDYFDMLRAEAAGEPYNKSEHNQGHCCKVSDEAAFCLIQRPYISKTLLTRRISPRGSP